MLVTLTCHLLPLKEVCVRGGKVCKNMSDYDAHNVLCGKTSQ